MGYCHSCLRNWFTMSRRASNYDLNHYTIDPFALNVRRVDLNIRRNSYLHNTEKYDLSKGIDPVLIIRRGSPFYMTITFQRNINFEDDIINLIFSVRDAFKASYSQRTEIVLPVTDENMNIITSSNNKEWSIDVNEINGRFLFLRVISSINTIIGQWNITIETRSLKSRGRQYNKFNIRPSMFILFNPWKKDDQTFLRSSEERDEYILNDTGIIWKGTSNLTKPTPWNYSQFESNVLPCCVYLLTSLGHLPISDRSDPIKVTRHLASVINYDTATGEGVLLGNWTGNYEGGREPNYWTGSHPILEQFYRTHRTVKYAQCWVFAGVMTTVCRSLGIPARTVTNYQSAHDTESSLTIDHLVNSEGELVNTRGDSVWNFHSWTEVNMRRPDLSFTSVYDGWQVIDATPQERSDGLFRVGPTSVNAIKKGEVTKNYDGKFVYAEVNADEIFWLKQGDREPVKFLEAKTESIGIKISTKKVGSNIREDITDNYKYKENTPEERETMLKALLTSDHIFTRYYINEKFSEVRFRLLLIDDVLIGKPFRVILEFYNRSNLVYTVASTIIVRTTLYTGVTHRIIKKDRTKKKISPRSNDEIVVHVSYEEYSKYLIDQKSFRVSAIAQVQETDFHYIATDDFRVRMPDITIEVEGDIFKNRPFICYASFTNPLPEKLTKGFFLIEGPGLGKPLKIPVKGTIYPEGEVRVSFTLTPQSEGEKTIIAKFSSKELNDVDGYKMIMVSSNPNEIDYSDDINRVTWSHY